jgi:hypothetical protein
METFSDMLQKVGVTDTDDVAKATAYLGVVTEEYSNLASQLPNIGKRQTTGIGCVEFFIKAYENQFVGYTTGREPVDEAEHDAKFSLAMKEWGVIDAEDQAAARKLLREYTDLMITNADAVLGHDRKAVAVVLAASRKILFMLQGGML